MYSTLAEKTTIDLNVSKKMYPFYEEGDVSFYKNKLIHIEDIIEQKEIDRGNAADFKSFETKVYHLLTFQDEMGNTHEYQSTIKPKNVGGIMYYVVENGKIKDVFSESDKERLKKYIDIKTEHKKFSKIYRFTQVFFRSDLRIITLFLCLWFLFSTFIYWSGNFVHFSKEEPFGSSLLLGGWSAFPVFITLAFFDSIFHQKAKKIMQKKQNEEKEAIFKTFI